MPFNIYFPSMFLETVKCTLKLKQVNFCNQLCEYGIFFHLGLSYKKHTLPVKTQWKFNAIIFLETSLILFKKKKGSKAIFSK